MILPLDTKELSRGQTAGTSQPCLMQPTNYRDISQLPTEIELDTEPTVLSILGIMTISESFILQFISTLTTFTIMLIQLLPSSTPSD